MPSLIWCQPVNTNKIAPGLNTCVNKNPLIHQIFAKVRNLNGKKKGPSKACRGLWDKEETCCDQTNLSAYGTKDASSISSAALNLGNLAEATYKNIKINK